MIVEKWLKDRATKPMQGRARQQKRVSSNFVVSEQRGKMSTFFSFHYSFFIFVQKLKIWPKRNRNYVQMYSPWVLSFRVGTKKGKVVWGDTKRFCSVPILLCVEITQESRQNTFHYCHSGVNLKIGFISTFIALKTDKFSFLIVSII